MVIGTAPTTKFTPSVAGVIDANIQAVNDVTVTGTGDTVLRRYVAAGMSITRRISGAVAASSTGRISGVPAAAETKRVTAAADADGTKRVAYNGTTAIDVTQRVGATAIVNTTKRVILA